MSTPIRDIVKENLSKDKGTILVTTNGKEYPDIDIVSENSEFIVIYPIKGVTEKQTLIYTKDIEKLKTFDYE